MKQISLLLTLFTLLLSCNTPAEENTKILWDEWGVPHIYAQNQEELGFSFGWAQMHSHANLILELYGKSRGQAAEYWGQDNLLNDQIVQTLGFPELAKEWWENQPAAYKSYAIEFTKGMNAYAEAHPDAIEESKKEVLPITETDIVSHYLFVIYTRFVGGGDLGQSQRWAEMGSNTYAVGSSRSASGNAMLVQNPHLPWFGEFLFYEAHLNAPDINAYGVTLLGFPTLGIAFNEHLGWSHTNNTIDNADLYELTLKDQGYVLDGEVQPFEARKKVLKVKQEDGSLKDEEITILQSEHGPIINQKEGKALAIRMPGFDQYFPTVQWWNMAKAKNFEEFEAALKPVQIPFFNIMYADKEGNIFYMFNGQVPIRASGDWDFWSGVVPGDKKEYIWTETHSFEDLPKVKNPAQGWLQNANDPPWTSTFPQALNHKDFPPYMAPTGMSFRPQRSARMLAEDESITFEELVEYKLSTRMEMADRLLDDLFEAVETNGSDLAKEAREVLANWDREADVDSEGAVLFYNWANKLGPWNPNTYEKPWDPKNARSTPDGLKDPSKAVKLLETAASEIKDGFGSLKVKWGDFFRLKYNGKDLPANGADGSVGVFRVAWPGGREEDGKLTVGGGDTWVSVIEFGDKVRAKVLLSYGNSTQPDSPHNGDQLDLFSKKELRDAWFYPEDLKGHVKKTEVLKDGKFTTGE